MKVAEGEESTSVVDLIALSVELTLVRASAQAVLAPTRSGATARNVSRFRLPVWITAFTPEASTFQALQFSYREHSVPNGLFGQFLASPAGNALRTSRTGTGSMLGDGARAIGRGHQSRLVTRLER